MKRKPYVIVRTLSAGVFAGILESRKGNEAVLVFARRIWYWAGAASLSELAVRGTASPSACKFPVPVPRVMLMDVIEILDVTPEARKSIEEVPEWTQHGSGYGTGIADGYGYGSGAGFGSGDGYGSGSGVAGATGTGSGSGSG